MSDLRLSSYLEDHRDRILADLFEWLGIPSISAQPDHAGDVRRSADYAAALLRSAGLEHVEVIQTAGAPAVYGDWLGAGSDAPTVLVYGHHDVQPVDPLDLWHTAPFEPEIVDGEIRARGAVDDKGQTMFQIAAVRALLETNGSLPVNLRFLIEGEEEVGSPNFQALLQDRAEQLACDVVVVSDTGMWSQDVPSMCVGMRGLVAFDVTVTTGREDLHSGSFGGAAPNPNHIVASLVAALHDTDGRVAIPGFYDDVRPLSDQERESLDALPFDEDEWLATAGVSATAGEAGRSILERVWTRPTCDVTGLGGGYAGPGVKTIVPASATAKVTFRLVADQQPDRISAIFEDWVKGQVPSYADLAITAVGGVAPALTPVDHPGIRALSRAIQRAWGKEPLLTREGGSGPEEALGRVLRAPVLYLGAALPGDRFHAPNERFVLDQFEKGFLAAGELWHELADALSGG